MFSRIEALNFRCLRYVSRELGGFHVLVGPNASGKTTFLDVIAFVSDLVSGGIEEAIGSRSGDFSDLIWRGQSELPVEIALEARLPESVLQRLATGANAKPDYDRIRYEIQLALNSESGGVQIQEERLILLSRAMPAVAHAGAELAYFPMSPVVPLTVLSSAGARGERRVISKKMGGNDNFYQETSSGTGKGWAPSFRLGPNKSALANLPDDETKFPAATWFRSFLTEGVQSFVLNSQLIRKASPPLRRAGFRPDGSNLPWVISDLKKHYPALFEEWIAHLRTALPDINNVRTVEREDDKHQYLVVDYQNDLSVPSWMVSDGTLRLMALTLPAYLKGFSGSYLIEEPENGIHPRAVEAVIQSLSSVYDAQILLASHSTVVLNIVEPGQILCFAKTQAGETCIVSGDQHPRLRDWKGEVNFSTLFAAGVLG